MKILKEGSWRKSYISTLRNTYSKKLIKNNAIPKWSKFKKFVTQIYKNKEKY